MPSFAAPWRATTRASPSPWYALQQRRPHPKCAPSRAAGLTHTRCCVPVQTRLLNASESLLDQSQDMNDLLKLLMHYQARGNTLLAQLQGSSVSLHDVLFYTLALCVPLVFITYPSDVRILLLAGVLACWGVERAVLQHLVMLFGPAGGLGSSSSSYGAVHDAKVAVRLVVLGGTLGVVVWLLLKRRAAHNRREAIFQAIQQTVSWLSDSPFGMFDSLQWHLFNSHA